MGGPVSIAELLDDLCARVLAAEDAGHAERGLRLPHDVLAQVAAVKQAELARGNPLMLLGLPVSAGEAGTPDRSEPDGRAGAAGSPERGDPS